ncbi:predicted protein [Botrytis cinerea T4]|uniref:Uncharacterized protein n=1 Tax=Botryotinia fuckeliana (strain T4) TaxID=999810 RepID=G2YWH2_BOTF4|nr:predicted protein [Botrytis cinerea T4]
MPQKATPTLCDLGVTIQRNLILVDSKNKNSRRPRSVQENQFPTIESITLVF